MNTPKVFKQIPEAGSDEDIAAMGWVSYSDFCEMQARLEAALAAAQSAGADERRATFMAGFIDFRDKALMKFKDLKGPLLSKGAIAYVCDVLRALSPPASVDTENERYKSNATVVTNIDGLGGTTFKAGERVYVRDDGDSFAVNGLRGWPTMVGVPKNRIALSSSAPAGAPSEEEWDEIMDYKGEMKNE